MNTLEFLQRVLPSEGVYVSAIIGDRTQQGFFQSVEELAKSVVATDKRGGNTYYAISAFKDKNKRTQDNVRATKVLALDVDCGADKPYPSWKEGLQALGKFVADLSLPKPMIVHSGNGLHVYWVLTRELEPEEWKPLAMAMKAATQAQAFHVDPAVPADNARVLRPVGTTNRKGNNPVRLLLDAPDVTPEQIAQCLRNYYTALPMAQPVSQRQTTGSSLLDSLAVQSDFAPTNPEAVVSKCQQIAWAVANQKDVDEPMWYALMGVAAFCENPESTAIAWSKDHPTFDEQETRTKVIQWKSKVTGPTTCEKFRNIDATRCKKCKFNGKITSPNNLGIQYVEAPVPVTAPDQTAFEVPMPKPFKRTTSGIKMTLDKTDIEICPFDIYPVSYGKDEVLGYETVRYHWNRPHMGWRELVFRQAYLAEGSREFSSCIADQGIVLKNKTTTEFFQQMLRSYMDELRQLRSMTNIFSTMGWKENFTQFVLGDTLLRRNDDGSVTEERISMSSTTQRASEAMFVQNGSLDAWSNFTSLIEKARLDAHIFALGVSFSSVLYAFSGLKGVVVSLYGPTGGGKTLAQYWQQSIYGDPDKLHFNAKFTQNALFSRLGMYCHLPMTIDETTLMEDKDVGDFIYWTSQGRDKARLNRTSEEREARVWACPTTVSTNKSMASKLIASGLDTDAQLARLLEISFDAHNLFTKDSTAGKRIYDFLMTNHGHAGLVFVKHLMSLGEIQIRAMIDQHTIKFRKKYNCKFEGKERFYEQAIILADLANEIAVKLGLAQYDHSRGTEYVLSQLGAIRKAVAENMVDSFDLIAEYLSEVADSHLVVSHAGDQKAMVDFNRLPRNGIKVRFDLFKPNNAQPATRGTVLFDRGHFRRWLSVRGADWKSFSQQLIDEQADATPKSKKFFLGKDSPIKTGQTYVVGINLCHPRLQGILDDTDQAIDDNLLGQLLVVK